MSWAETTLGELIVLQRGHDLTGGERRPGSVPVIGSAGQNGFHDTVRCKGPGLTVGRSGASIGVVTYVKEDFWPHNTALYVKDFKGNDPAFIAALLRSLDLKSLNSGSAQPSLNRNFVYPVRVRVPRPSIQRRIADILSAYDDLIENNSRRIAILEDMARRLFEEWFFHRRGLPSIATPVEWRELAMGELFSFTGGGDWGSEEPTPDESEAVTVIRGTDFDDFDGGRAIRSPVRFISQKSFNKRRLQVGDILVENSINAKSRTAGKTLLITDGILKACSGRAIGASFCKQYRPLEPCWSPVIYLYMKGQFERGEMAYFQNVAANGIANFQSQRYLAEALISLPRDKEVVDTLASRSYAPRGV